MEFTSIEKFRSILRERRARNETVRERAALIIDETRRRGDEALREFTRRFDRVEIDDFRVPTGEIEEAGRNFLDPEWRKRLDDMAGRIRRFAEKEKPAGFRLEEKGGRIERVYLPVGSAGLYVPAGTAPLLSTVFMTAIPARVAGVERIAICSPPDRHGRVNRAVLAAAHFLGIDEIYRVGGAQAVAALAFGTESIPGVDLVAGPGNEYVAEAKRLVYGQVALDCPAGPSEVAVYADSGADPDTVAAELAAQAEHHAGLSVLVTDDEKIAGRLAEEKSPGYTLLVKDREKAVEMLNEIASEHLVLICRDPEKMARGVKNAGAVFLGRYTPVALGDYLAGPSHVLPTGGAARSFAGLSTLTFLRGVAIVEWEKTGLAGMAGDLEALAGIEELPAHAESVSARLGRGRKDD